MVLNDITRLRRLENVRRDFVANVSHEIRTPITSIKGFVETLRDDQAGDSGHGQAVPGDHRPAGGAAGGPGGRPPQPLTDRGGGTGRGHRASSPALWTRSSTKPQSS